MPPRAIQTTAGRCMKLALNTYPACRGSLSWSLCLQCFQHLFTGPRMALKVTPGKAAGKKSLADLYNMTEVLPEYIAYVAVLVRALRFYAFVC